MNATKLSKIKNLPGPKLEAQITSKLTIKQTEVDTYDNGKESGEHYSYLDSTSNLNDFGKKNSELNIIENTETQDDFDCLDDFSFAPKELHKLIESSHEDSASFLARIEEAIANSSIYKGDDCKLFIETLKKNRLSDTEIPSVTESEMSRAINIFEGDSSFQFDKTDKTMNFQTTLPTVDQTNNDQSDVSDSSVNCSPNETFQKKFEKMYNQLEIDKSNIRQSQCRRLCTSILQDLIDSIVDSKRIYTTKFLEVVRHNNILENLCEYIRMYMSLISAGVQDSLLAGEGVYLSSLLPDGQLPHDTTLSTYYGSTTELNVANAEATISCFLRYTSHCFTKFSKRIKQFSNSIVNIPLKFSETFDVTEIHSPLPLGLDTHIVVVQSDPFNRSNFNNAFIRELKQWLPEKSVAIIYTLDMCLSLGKALSNSFNGELKASTILNAISTCFGLKLLQSNAEPESAYHTVENFDAAPFTAIATEIIDLTDRILFAEGCYSKDGELQMNNITFNDASFAILFGQTIYLLSQLVKHGGLFDTSITHARHIVCHPILEIKTFSKVLTVFSKCGLREKVTAMVQASAETDTFNAISSDAALTKKIKPKKNAITDTKSPKLPTALGINAACTQLQPLNISLQAAFTVKFTEIHINDSTNHSITSSPSVITITSATGPTSGTIFTERTLESYLQQLTNLKSQNSTYPVSAVLTTNSHLVDNLTLSLSDDVFCPLYVLTDEVPPQFNVDTENLVPTSVIHVGSSFQLFEAFVAAFMDSFELNSARQKCSSTAEGENSSRLRKDTSLSEAGAALVEQSIEDSITVKDVNESHGDKSSFVTPNANIPTTNKRIFAIIESRRLSIPTDELLYILHSTGLNAILLDKLPALIELIESKLTCVNEVLQIWRREAGEAILFVETQMNHNLILLNKNIHDQAIISECNATISKYKLPTLSSIDCEDLYCELGNRIDMNHLQVLKFCDSLYDSLQDQITSCTQTVHGCLNMIFDLVAFIRHQLFVVTPLITSTLSNFKSLPLPLQYSQIGQEKIEKLIAEISRDINQSDESNSDSLFLNFSSVIFENKPNSDTTQNLTQLNTEMSVNNLEATIRLELTVEILLLAKELVGSTVQALQSLKRRSSLYYKEAYDHIEQQQKLLHGSLESWRVTLKDSVLAYSQQSNVLPRSQAWVRAHHIAASRRMSLASLSTSGNKSLVDDGAFCIQPFCLTEARN